MRTKLDFRPFTQQWEGGGCPICFVRLATVAEFFAELATWQKWSENQSIASHTQTWVSQHFSSLCIFVLRAITIHAHFLFFQLIFFSIHLFLLFMEWIWSVKTTFEPQQFFTSKFEFKGKKYSRPHCQIFSFVKSLNMIKFHLLRKNEFLFP